jgi:hypothetical protein
LAGQFLSRQPAGQVLLEEVSDPADLPGRFVDEFKTKMMNPDSPQLIEMPAGLLRLGPKNCVAAAHIGHDRVSAAVSIPQRQPVLFAWLPAIFVTGSL